MKEQRTELRVSDIRYSTLLSVLNGKGKTINELEDLLNLEAPTIRKMIAGYRKLGKGIVSINRRYRYGTKAEIKAQADRHMKRALKQLHVAFALTDTDGYGALVIKQVKRQWKEVK